MLLESARVHGIVPALNRSCVKPYKVPGSDLTIEKGTMVWIPVLGIHNDPEIFPQPEKYDPDRYVDTDQKNNILTFGMGQKYCIGKRFK